MATTTAPEVQPQPKTAAPVLTPSAIAKVKEIMASQTPVPSGLRLSVVGGGCVGAPGVPVIGVNPGPGDTGCPAAPPKFPVGPLSDTGPVSRPPRSACGT